MSEWFEALHPALVWGPFAAFGFAIVVVDRVLARRWSR